MAATANATWTHRLFYLLQHRVLRLNNNGIKCEVNAMLKMTGGHALPLPAFANVNESTFHMCIYRGMYILYALKTL